VEDDEQTKFLAWVAALERRYLADLRVKDVARALRALSSAYVERRERGTRQHVHGALDSAGKRAAFALYYAPLHFMAVIEVVRALGAHRPAPASIVDMGCGTGVAGAAWAIAAGSTPTVLGLDRHPWAVADTRWTLRQLGVEGRARQADLARPHAFRPGASIVAAYTLNELADSDRRRVEEALVDATRRGGRLLIVEPLAKGVAPWWPLTAARIVDAGGRADEWRLPIEPPPIVGQLGSAAGLNYQELRLQTLYL
jgi:SAM-dependent methyltransferase